MYRESARFYDWICRGKDYQVASDKLREHILHLNPDASSLLDAACGTGRHLQQLKEHFDAAGLDKSAEMLRIARERCPHVPFYRADLTDFRIDRTFDVVTCLFGSLAHAKTLRNMNDAVRCMASHLSANGMLIIEPWATPETFHENRLNFDFMDEPELKLARMYISRRQGRISVFEIEYLVGRPNGVEHFTECMEMGLFSREEYQGALINSGLEVVLDDETGLFGYGLYIALKKE